MQFTNENLSSSTTDGLPVFVARTLAHLSMVAPKPNDSAGLLAAARGAVKGIDCLIIFGLVTTLEVQTVVSEIEALIASTQRYLENNIAVESQNPLTGRKGQYLQWQALVSLDTPNANMGALLLGGSEFLVAWKGKRSISTAAAIDIRRAGGSEQLSVQELKLLLTGSTSANECWNAWHLRLQRSWRTLTKDFNLERKFEAFSFEYRARGQILETSSFAPPMRRMGAGTHRQLSALQLAQVFDQVAIWCGQDDIFGAISFIEIVSGLSVELAAELPLNYSSSLGENLLWMDIHSGHLVADVGFMATGAASATTESGTNSGFRLHKRMPKSLSMVLRNRFQKHPSAHCLADLFPGKVFPDRGASIIDSTDEIKPTWARLRRSIANHLRIHGINNLLAAGLTLDFSSIPRSKLFYANISDDEFQLAEQAFFKLMSWEL